ncbi:hypothetical protein ABZY45_13345 [Streptomyces sp. NPDC006516]|uniref:hypothetical protein n=1 Tax=Streptomyces sp. NPDC006516 TaxID=3154309 RepID=UPI0033AB37C4
MDNDSRERDDGDSRGTETERSADPAGVAGHQAAAEVAQPPASPGGKRNPDDWIALSFAATAYTTFFVSLLGAFVWLCFASGDYAGSISGRVAFVAVVMVPAVLACGAVAFAAGFVAPFLVGLVRGGARLFRWAGRKIFARPVRPADRTDGAGQPE